MKFIMQKPKYQKTKPRKSMYQQCKHMKKIKFMGSYFCVCKSNKGGSYKYNPKYANIIRRFNLFVMGSQNRINEYDNWWKLCVNGKDPLAGTTPTRCIYY